MGVVSIGQANTESQIQLQQELAKISKLKGIQALRLSKLADGSEKEKPDLDIFIDNIYRGNVIPDLTSD